MIVANLEGTLLRQGETGGRHWAPVPEYKTGYPGQDTGPASPLASPPPTGRGYSGYPARWGHHHRKPPGQIPGMCSVRLPPPADQGGVPYPADVFPVRQKMVESGGVGESGITAGGRVGPYLMAVGTKKRAR